MGIPPQRVKGTLTRRDFLGVCGSASTLLIPAPLCGELASLLARDAAATAATATSLFSDYRIVPHYRVHSPLEELIRKARQKQDDYPSERYSREIEGYFAHWGCELC